MLILRFLFLGFILQSCCSQSTMKEDLNDNKNNQTPNVVAINRSIVTLMVKSIINSEAGVIVEAEAVTVEQDDGYPSLAVVGMNYKLTPVYFIDETGGKPDNEKNRKFNSLSSLKKGDEFKAIIFMEKSMKWFIQEIIN